MEEQRDVARATAFKMERILSDIPISKGGPISFVIYGIHALHVGLFIEMLHVFVEVYEYMMTQHTEKEKLRNGKVESSIAQKLLDAQDEYDEVTRLCVFRVKSLKEGQCRSLLTQDARHHAAQLNFFRKGLKTLEAVEPFIRNVAEKHRIDYQLNGLPNRESVEARMMEN
ncbi:hypothetical protein CTI12_AA273980 [Artemisia annua]|uniref:Uncharacterized protein n=1 Tax=Artemisia annua TaxID=35608 RepID=A0A2U1NEG1_ARTAN|nr:hypothetical protein CTI12_AA273980 [Artemisia annua]